MALTAAIRIQVCGSLAVEVDGERREARLPGGQGRLLLTYLVLRRNDGLSRDRLVEALWPNDPPQAADTAVYALVSKLRTALGPNLVSFAVRSQLTLPADSWVDLEAARDGVHRAESALALGGWGRALGAAQMSLSVAGRGFLPDEELEWATPVRRELEEMYVALSRPTPLRPCTWAAPSSPPPSRRASWSWPHRSGRAGTRTLMRALAAQGNTAEALVAYESLRVLFRGELGVAPGPETRELYQALLGDDRS